MKRRSGTLTVAALLSACGGQSDPNASIAERRDAIRQGTVASDPQVVALVARRSSCDGPPPEVLCSGTLIAEQWVLTAAHCVRASPRGMLEVFFGTTPGEPGGIYRGIATRVVHPLYDRAFDDYDVALVRLIDRAPVAPTSLVNRPLDPSWSGRTARVVGFGKTSADAGEEPKQKLQGTVTITDITERTVTYGPAPSMTCPGDSGGPVFLDVDGTEALIAVTTSGDAPCERRGVASRTDSQVAEFVASVLASGAPSPTDAISTDGVCSASCNDDQDCPGDLTCGTADDGTNRCLLPNILVGNLLAACRHDGDCTSGPCVPLGDECRCSQPCAGPSGDGDGNSGGCRFAYAPRGAPSYLWLLAMLAAVLRIRRT